MIKKVDLRDMNQNKGIVKIIGSSTLGEQLVAAAGRISTQAGTATEILERSKDEEKNQKLIEKVTKSGHSSVIEHGVFHLAFENVSVFVEQFMIEFRLASFIVKSRRYVDFSSAGYYTPVFSKNAITNDYKSLVDFLFAEYTRFCEAGVPKEDARFLLPYCLHSNFYCTVNARELLHMLKSMLYGRGSDFAEIKGLGESLFAQLAEIAPGICVDFQRRNKGYDNRLDFSDLLGQEKGVRENEGGKLAELVSSTPNAVETVIRGALLGVNQMSEENIQDVLSNEGHRKTVLDSLFASRRPRALEHVSYSFRLNGVSLSTITHFTRHRIQSIELPLLTKTDRSKYILPPTIAENPQLCMDYKAAFSKMQEWHESMKTMGVSEQELVYCQLSGNVLDFALTMNARELFLFFNLRTCNRAQWEIQNYADEMLRLCRQDSPELFSRFGPSCFTDKCPEGPMTCGRAAETKEKYTYFA